MSATHPALRNLRENVDRFMARCLERHGEAMACAEGCATCCEADLTVFPVEATPLAAAVAALPAGLRVAIGERVAAGAHCALLVDDRCVVYEERPIICRTQGLPLRLQDGSVASCPLNFSGAPEALPPEDHLDLERLNVMLSVLHRAAQGAGAVAERVRLADLASSRISRP